MERMMEQVLAHLKPKPPIEQYQLLAALIAALREATTFPLSSS